MPAPRKVFCVIGTRPEAIKMAPVVLRLRQQGSPFEARVVATGQHRALLDQALADFGLKADHDLNLMRADQSLADLAARALQALNELFARERPDCVLGQGDTTSVLAAALAASYQRIPFGHVEAGLRTGCRDAPFPEETNRVLVSHLASLHFAPTESAGSNLLREGIATATIHVTGNTVIDALLWTAGRMPPMPVAPPTDKYLLVTAHRREHFGAPLEAICQAIRQIVDKHDDLSVVFPVHPNPNVRRTVHAFLEGRERIQLIEPVDYPAFVALMSSAWLILTDSGGIQEEAPALGKPVLVMRQTTERPETLDATGVLVGPQAKRICAAVESLKHDPDHYQALASAGSPFGDGWAAERVVRALHRFFAIDAGPRPRGMPLSRADRRPAGWRASVHKW